MKRVHRTCVVLFLMFLLWAGGMMPVCQNKTAYDKTTEDRDQTKLPGTTEDQGGHAWQGTTEASNQSEDTVGLLAVYDMIGTVLENGTKDFFRGYPVDETFVGWIAETYGAPVLEQLASALAKGEAEDTLWRELTGSTMHVLWLDYCRAYGYATYLCESVIWKDAADSECITIDFIGDINFDERWHTMLAAEELGSVEECIGARVQRELQSADITIVNNEFTYTGTDGALNGKAYTFKSDPANVKLLDIFGTDLAVLANNHTYDYGMQGLLDTMDSLQAAGIMYSGAGRNLAEASAVRYFVIGGRKLAVVSATEIERYSRYTKQATETEPGVLKTQQDEIMLAVLQEAKEHSDYVFAYLHWGAEGNVICDYRQKKLARIYADAGVDAIIGGHPHRLQGVTFMDDIPVVYSLGNFWFSNGTLYTTIAQLQIQQSGEVSLRMLPCIQRDGRTEMLDGEPAREFYRYLADISMNVGIDEDGYIFSSPDVSGPGQSPYAYASGRRYGLRLSDVDLEGRRIDIVGNLE